MSNEQPTFAEMIALFDGPASNASLRINDQRRAVILQALQIAQESGDAVDALRPAAASFDLSKLTFGSRYLLGQLRGGPAKFGCERAATPAMKLLESSGLVNVEWLDQEDHGLVRVSLTAKGEAAR